MTKVCDLPLHVQIFCCAAQIQFILYVILKQKDLVKRPSLLQKAIFIHTLAPRGRPRVRLTARTQVARQSARP
jgi:hypothetical protein